MEAFGCSGIGIAAEFRRPFKKCSNDSFGLGPPRQRKAAGYLADGALAILEPHPSLRRRRPARTAQEKGWSDWILGDDEEDEVAIRPCVRSKAA